ncbi:MAG TPA: oligoendopeptidase F [Azospirillaceae bacterium]|nr:oligoendopeptidase F [Azospirillaceae bacterium]
MSKTSVLTRRLAGAAAIALLAGLAPVATSYAADAPAKQAAAKVDERYVWDMTDMYRTPADWDAARKEVVAALPQLAALKGTLGTDAKAMQKALDTISAATLKFERVYVYAASIADTDTRVAEAQERENLVRALAGEFGSATAWLSPEVQALGAEKVEAFIKAEPGLAKHAFSLRDILRNKPHTLSADTEAALAAVAPVLGASSNAYNLLSNSDIDWPTIKLKDNTEAKISQTGYQKYREHPDREIRKQVFDAFWTKYGQYTNTMGMTLGTRVQSGVIQAKLRNYPSAVAASLADNNIPEQVYRSLVAEANNGLPTLHRYFKLRQRMLGLPDMHYYDIYPPMVGIDRDFGVEEAKKLTLAAVKPLGDEYQKEIKKGLDGRWMHVYPAEGKQSGAYQNGVYGVHPYVFLNYQDNYDAVSTFAHEWGHALHTVLADKNNPYETAGYSLFLAEIASTANEFLLADHMLANAKTKQEKLYFLGHQLESMRATFFRQTMFAEFELATHDAVERGEALSGKRMTQIYGDLLKRYHGHDKGVLNIDDKYTVEWAFIPHFYRPFYVYQYATSMAASAYFTEQIQKGYAKGKAEGDKARDTYLAVLKAGGSDYPYEVLKKAGLDMASPAPYQALVRRMDGIMDQMEQLLNEKG